MAIVIVVLIVAVLALPFAWPRFLGRRRSRNGRVLWRGYISFQESLLSEKELFPGIQERRAIGGVGRKGLSAGICEMDHHGITWTSAAWYTPQTRIKGSFRLPWSEIVDGEAYRMPMRISALGGGVRLTLSEDRGILDGEFLGSIDALNDAIQVGAGTETSRP